MDNECLSLNKRIIIEKRMSIEAANQTATLYKPVVYEPLTCLPICLLNFYTIVGKTQGGGIDNG
jgi:hypothetical protein